MRTGEDEAHSPKYAHVERERRWLIDPRMRPALPDKFVLIEDRYVTGTRFRVRRMTDSESGAQALKLTKKYEAADVLARAIVTAYLTAEELELMATLPASLLTKRRYKLVADDLAWSIDRFEGALAGLELAEMEWPDDTGLRGLPPPPGAVREVSDDPRYQGGTLAINGIPEEILWPASSSSRHASTTI